MKVVFWYILLLGLRDLGDRVVVKDERTIKISIVCSAVWIAEYAKEEAIS